MTGNNSLITYINRGVYLLVSNYNASCVGGVMTWYKIYIGAEVPPPTGLSLYITETTKLPWFNGSRSNLFLGNLANVISIPYDNCPIYLYLPYATNGVPVIFDNSNPIYAACNYLHFIKLDDNNLDTIIPT